MMVSARPPNHATNQSDAAADLAYDTGRRAIKRIVIVANGMATHRMRARNRHGSLPRASSWLLTGAVYRGNDGVRDW